jgi:aspartyl-tRNA(Asn)/glutamyl-tRNA(Gln) amidotransferase subunit C
MDVARVARLAEMELTADEIEGFGRDLKRILEHVEEIAALDLDAVPTTARVEFGGQGSTSRPDEPVAGLEREAALAAAPRADEGAFLVPGFVDAG